MKKLLLGIVCLGLFWQNANCSNVKEFSVKSFNKTMIKYMYNPKTEQCLPTKPGDMDLITHHVRTHDIDIVQIYDSVPGQLTIIRIYNQTGYTEHVLTSTYGACLMYVDDIINHIDNIDTENYVGLEYSK